MTDAQIQNSDTPVGEDYRYYKDGRVFTLLDIARIGELGYDSPLQAVFQGILSTDTWIRPLSEFTEEVEQDGVMVKRFTLIEDGDD